MGYPGCARLAVVGTEPAGVAVQGLAAVGQDLSAGDVAGLVPAEEDRQGRDILWPAQTTDRGVGQRVSIDRVTVTSYQLVLRHYGATA